MGDIRLRIAKGVFLILHDALFVPSSTVRLISVSALAIKNGMATYFDDEIVKITNKSQGIQ